MKDVLLVNPPPAERVPARIAAPPLGLLYLSAALKARGIGCVVLDAEAEGLTLDQTAAVAQTLRPAVLGVPVMTPTADAAYALLERVRPFTSCLVLGGAHVSALGSGIFSDCPVPVEAAVGGEAEEVFPEFVSRILAGAAPDDIDLPGVLKPGSLPPSPPRWPRISHLDALPFPDRRAVPSQRYRHPLLPGGPVATLITSRGCPYRCIFCDKNIGGTAWRPRSAENVLAEMEELVLACGLRRLIIYDDLFTLDRGRILTLCEGIRRRRLNLRWKCEGRVNRVDKEMLAAMKAAGCELIAYGVETAGERGLAFLQKDITREQVVEAFALTREAGIQTLGYYLVGIPGETVEDVMETVKLAIETKADYAQFGVLTPLPGTPLYAWVQERGWLKEVQARGPAERGRRRAVIMDGYWSVERLDEALSRAHGAFYFRPSYLVRRLQKVHSPAELFEGVVQAWRLSWWTWTAGQRRGKGGRG